MLFSLDEEYDDDMGISPGVTIFSCGYNVSKQVPVVCIMNRTSLRTEGLVRWRCSRSEEVQPIL